jgi:hypothetical protein
MAAPEGLTRDQLYANWLTWVTNNLGDDSQMTVIAANAAADAAVKGEGFNAAAEAARKAWVEAAPPDRQLWRPGFWSLLFTNLYFWLLVALVVSIPFVFVTIILVPFALIVVGWKAYLFWRLSNRGIVEPGSLVGQTAPKLWTIQAGRGGSARGYTATYQFNYHGLAHMTSHAYALQDSVRQDVLVLFDPKHPWLNMVMPEVLNPGA